LANLKESSKEREKTLKQKLKEVTIEKDRLAGLEVSHTANADFGADKQDELDAMKTSARMRSVSQSVQPEDPPSAKKQRAASVKPKERAKRQPSIVEEEAEVEPVSEAEEPVVEKPKNKAPAKPAAEKKAKENKPVAPRLTVRKVGRGKDLFESGANNLGHTC
jgi:hypothetical protein